MVTGIAAFDRREKMLKLRKERPAVEEAGLHGGSGYSVDEVAGMMRAAIREAQNAG